MKHPTSEDSHVIHAGSHIAIRRIHALHAIDGSPVLVFLHGGLGSIRQWNDFPQAVCDLLGFDGLLFDRRGHGASDPMPSRRNERFYIVESVALHSLLASEGIDRSILVGHSDGATIALAAASSHPDRVRAVVACAPHVFTEPALLAGVQATAVAWKTTALRSRLSRYHGPNTDAVFADWTATWLDPDMAEWSMVEDLRRITCPVLIIQGENDPYGGVRQVSAIADVVTSHVETLLIPSCGHDPHIEQRCVVLESISAFVGKI